MKKLFICFIVSALMFFAFTGCSSDNTKQNGQDMKSETSHAQKPTESQESGQNPTVIKTNDGSLSVATDKSVKLPKGYPSDKFPIYDGSFIYSVIELEGSYVISAFSKDEVKKVIAFYEKVLDGAKVDMDTKTDESLTSMGTKSGYAYTMDVGKSTEKGYQTIITISLQPAK
ncbi:MAG: hypothetical protein HPY70_09985 [Firmicutes bacterium]|jgi:hypothetical protein|nr:hypothetical protein [Bacillota bacterium]